MTEEEIKKLQDDLAQAQKDKEAAEAKVTELEGTIKEKDGVIEQKNQDIVGIRRKYGVSAEEDDSYKTFDEMSEEEKADMSEQDIARKKEQDQVYLQNKADREQRTEERTRTINERKENALSKLVGDTDTEVREKMLKNFESIKGSEDAFTEGEVASFMQTAFNMLGDERPDPIRDANNGGGTGDAPAAMIDPNLPSEGGYADSKEGTSLGQTMGLRSAQPDEGGEAK